MNLFGLWVDLGTASILQEKCDHGLMLHNDAIEHAYTITKIEKNTCTHFVVNCQKPVDVLIIKEILSPVIVITINKVS